MINYWSPVGHKATITMLTVVVVSITGFFLGGGLVSPTPNPQPGGPGNKMADSF